MAYLNKSPSMRALTFLFALAANLAVVSAHFQILAPEWRANSFLAPYSQYTYPCAGVPEGLSVTNRTQWPLTGGSLSIDFHHPWTYVFINLGLGSNVTNFNITLNNGARLINETGNGTLCVDKFTLPSNLGIVDGQAASLQIATVGPNGAALYNCADITFSSNATLLPTSQCSNSTGVSWSYVTPEGQGSTVTSPSNATGTGSASSSTAKSAAVSSYGKSWGTGFVALVAVCAVVVF